MEKTVSSLLDKLRWEGLCSEADIASGCGVFYLLVHNDMSILFTKRYSMGFLWSNEP